jgi:hypothetical protein
VLAGGVSDGAELAGGEPVLADGDSSPHAATISPAATAGTSR